MGELKSLALLFTLQNFMFFRVCVYFLSSYLMFSYTNDRLTFALALILLFFLPARSNAQRQESFPSGREASRGASFSMKELIKLVLERSDPVRIQRLEILKSDTALRKSNSIYAPVLESGMQKQFTKQRYTNSFVSGDTTEITKSYIKAKKLFSSGTYFETEAADIYRSSEEVNNPAFTNLGSASGVFTPAKLHTTNLSIVLRQELLKNVFGYNSRRNEQIQRSKAEIQRQNLIYNLTALVVNTMIEFWQLAIARENIRTSQRLLENTRKVRSITIRKRGLGLAEAFETRQWNALLSQAKTRLGESTLRHSSLQRNFLRTLNFSPKRKLDTSAKLETKLPQNLNFQKDLDFAYRTRPDYRAILLEKENARKALEIAENQLLPSLSLGARYNRQGFDRQFSQAYDHSLDGRYPEYSFDFKLEYPLWDEGLKAERRNAKVNLKQVNIRKNNSAAKFRMRFNRDFRR